MRWTIGMILGIVMLVAVPRAVADGYCRSRAVYNYVSRATYSYTPAYTQTYTTPYAPPAYDYSSVYIKTVPYPTSPDYYSSVQDHYRDKLLVDAFAGKTVEIVKGQLELNNLKQEVEYLRRAVYGGQQPQQPLFNQQPQQQPPPPQQEQAQPMPRATGGLPVPEGLQAIVQASCIRCHGANNATAGGGYDFQNLAAIPRDVRLLMKADVDDGHMPKGGKALDDQAAALFHRYATGRNGTQAAQK